MQGLDDYQTQQSDITLEALRGLISLIPHLTYPQFEKHYTNLIFRIKQFFENVSLFGSSFFIYIDFDLYNVYRNAIIFLKIIFQENNEMRYTSIRLYGELCSKTKEFEIAVDMSLHHNNVVTFLMHLCEDNKNIVQVSIYNL